MITVYSGSINFSSSEHNIYYHYVRKKKLWLKKDTAVDSECTCGVGLYLFTGIWGWDSYNMLRDKGLANKNREICIT